MPVLRCPIHLTGIQISCVMENECKDTHSYKSTIMPWCVICIPLDQFLKMILPSQQITLTNKVTF